MGHMKILFTWEDKLLIWLSIDIYVVRKKSVTVVRSCDCSKITVFHIVDYRISPHSRKSSF